MTCYTMSFPPPTHAECSALPFDAVEWVACHVERTTLPSSTGSSSLFFSHSWTARPSRWRYYDPSKCQKLPAQRHSITSNMTWICSSTSVMILNLAPTHRLLMKSDDHTMPSAATSAATPTTHGTHLTFNGLSIQQDNNYNELTSVSHGIYSSKM